MVLDESSYSGEGRLSTGQKGLIGLLPRKLYGEGAVVGTERQRGSCSCLIGSFLIERVLVSYYESFRKSFSARLVLKAGINQWLV